MIPPPPPLWRSLLSLAVVSVIYVTAACGLFALGEYAVYGHVRW